MSLSGLGIFAIISYSGWALFNILERIKKDNDDMTVITYVEAMYSVIMTYFLAIQSVSFLYITMIVAFAHILVGLYVEIFKPEILANSSVMTRFWSYLAIDISISIMSYLIILGTST